MQAEREELVKRVFPQVRALCESRGVTWTEVDLRWGLTDEDVAEQRTLELCLTEVRNCRPFFLALLGRRYGWIPPDIPAGLLEREPWLADRRGRSVTELEILYGALEEPDAQRHAYYCIRSPEQDASGGGQEDADARRKLADLKERVRASGLPVRVGFRDARELGELVLADLMALVNKLFPADENVSWLDLEKSYQAAFVASRTRLYIQRSGGYFRALDEHVSGDGPPPILAVVGESGIGKSALLANWLDHAAATREQLVVAHFLAGHGAAEWDTMLRVLIAELAQWMGRGEEPPADPRALRVAFSECLQTAAAACAETNRKLVLVLDGLDRLADHDGAPDLVWLPEQLPAPVRLIASAAPGRPLDQMHRRGCKRLEIEPLAGEERH